MLGYRFYSHSPLMSCLHSSVSKLSRTHSARNAALSCACLANFSFCIQPTSLRLLTRTNPLSVKLLRFRPLQGRHSSMRLSMWFAPLSDLGNMWSSSMNSFSSTRPQPAQITPSRLLCAFTNTLNISRCDIFSHGSCGRWIFHFKLGAATSLSSVRKGGFFAVSDIAECNETRRARL